MSFYYVLVKNIIKN